MRSYSALTLAAALILPWAATAQTQDPAQAPTQPLPAPAPMAATPADADTTAIRTHLDAARQAHAAGRIQQTRENLEQAETRLLTRSVLPDQAGTPMTGGAVAEITAAREALNRRDRASVGRHIDQAMARLQMPAASGAAMGGAAMGADSATGIPAPRMPAQGGGAAAPAAVAPVPSTSEPAPAPMFQPGPMPGPSRM